MLFDKVYGCYYRAVRGILKEAAQKPLSAGRMDEIVRACGFQESALTILPKIKEGIWAFGEMDRGISVRRCRISRFCRSHIFRKAG